MSTNTLRRPDASGWLAALYNENGSFVYSSAYASTVLALLAAQPGERIVDFGCGSGEITLELKKIVEQAKGGMVVGVDASESMVARAKANGVKHAFACDIQALEFPDNFPGRDEKFDAVFSNAALHWCKANPMGVLESAKKVLKPGGRFVAEMGGFMNCSGVRSVLHCVLRSRGYDPRRLDPWYFPSVEQYEKLLIAASFKPVEVSLTHRLTPLPAGLHSWLELFVRYSFLAGFSDEEAKEIMDEVVEGCRIDCQDESGRWALSYMRLKIFAVLES